MTQIHPDWPYSVSPHWPAADEFSLREEPNEDEDDEEEDEDNGQDDGDDDDGDDGYSE